VVDAGPPHDPIVGETLRELTADSCCRCPRDRHKGRRVAHEPKCDEAQLACFVAPSRAHLGDAQGDRQGPHAAAWHGSGGLIFAMRRLT
jgi:hypothetical protein